MVSVLMLAPMKAVIDNTCPDWVPTWLCTLIRGVANPSPEAAGLFMVGVALLILWSFTREVTR